MQNIPGGDDRYISYREAVREFATKESMFAMGAAVQTISKVVGDMPTRGEMQATERLHNLALQTVKDEQVAQGKKLDELLSNQLPKWTIPAVMALLAGAAIFIPHLWK